MQSARNETRNKIELKRDRNIEVSLILQHTASVDSESFWGSFWERAWQVNLNENSERAAAEEAEASRSKETSEHREVNQV